MKRFVFVVAYILAVSSLAHAQNRKTPTIATGPHDLGNGTGAKITLTGTDSGQTCVFCHAPHGGATNIALWNRQASGATYSLYASTTSDAKTDNSTLSNSGSGACLSCHDGTIAMDVLTNVNGGKFNGGGTFALGTNPNASFANNKMAALSGTSAGSFLGTDLQNDHPVAIKYEDARSAKAAQFQTLATSGVNNTKISTKVQGVSVTALPLFGTDTATATVECATCHDAHNNTNGNFLRGNNQNSGMCLACHIK